MTAEDPTLTIRANRASRNLGSAGFQFLVLLVGGFVADPKGLAAMQARPDGGRVIAALLFALLGCSALCLGLLAWSRRSAVIISPEAITVRGVLRERTIPLGEVLEVRWVIRQKLTQLVLKAARGKAAIDLGLYSYSRPDLIVAALRSRLDPALQRDWDRFAALTGLDDRGLPLDRPAEGPDPIDEDEAARNRARWDRLFPWVSAVGASAQVLIADAYPPPSRGFGLGFVVVLIVALWPAPGSFAPSGTLQWLRSIPGETYREIIGCLWMLAKAILITVGLMILAFASFIAMVLGILVTIKRIDPGFAADGPAVLIVSFVLIIMLLPILFVIDRRNERAIMRRVAARRRGSDAPDEPSTPGTPER
jgi:hypothetical protein